MGMDYTSSFFLIPVRIVVHKDELSDAWIELRGNILIIVENELQLHTKSFR